MKRSRVLGGKGKKKAPRYPVTTSTPIADDDEDIADDIAFGPEDEAMFGAHFVRRTFRAIPTTLEQNEEDAFLSRADTDANGNIDISTLLDTPQEREARRRGRGKRSHGVRETLQEGTAPASLDLLMAASKQQLPSAAAERIGGMARSDLYPTASMKHVDDYEARAVTRQEVGANLKKWNYLVHRMRTADHVQFPLRSTKDSATLTNLSTLASSLPPKTALEKKISGVLEQTGLARVAGDDDHDSNAPDVPFAEDGEPAAPEDSKLMSGGYLAKLKAVMSYNVEKRKRTNKIRSKAYHRMMRKEKDKATEKQMKELYEVDPDAAALKRRQQMDKMRAVERATLKHKNTSKWVRHVKRTAMWDKGARDALNQEGRIHENLTRKMTESALVGTAGKDDDSSGDDARQVDTLVAGSAAERKAVLEQMRSVGKGGEASASDPFAKARAGLAGMAFMQRAQEKKELAVLDDIDALERDVEAFREGNDVDGAAPIAQGTGARKKFTTSAKGTVRLPPADTNDVAADVAPADLSEPKRRRPLPPGTAKAAEQADLIRRAFAADDVMAELRKEKDEALAKDATPIDTAAALPGWNEWGGVDPALNRRQVARLERMKLKQKMEMDALRQKRRDAGLEHVYISENADAQPEKYVPLKVPFPYESQEQYDRAMRMPLGKEWNTSLTVEQMTRPAVVTRRGTIIDPLDDAVRTRQKPKSLLKKN